MVSRVLAGQGARRFEQSGRSDANRSGSLQERRFWTGATFVPGVDVLIVSANLEERASGLRLHGLDDGAHGAGHALLPAGRTGLEPQAASPTGDGPRLRARAASR